MPNPPLLPITSAPPQKKRGCGCFGTGCAIVLVLLLIGAGVGLWIGYSMMEYLKGFTSEQPVQIAAVEGTEEEYQAVKQKVDAFKNAYDRGQSSAMQLTAREINILIARDPELSEIKGRAAVSIENGIIGSRVSVPLDLIPIVNMVPQFKGRYFNGDIKFRLNVDDGVGRLTMDEIRVGDKVAPPDFLTQFSEGWTRSINDSPENQRAIERIQKLEAQGDVLIIETKPGPAALPEASTPENP